jgi:SagB-type dehydrogenase family enzyme
MPDRTEPRDRVRLRRGLALIPIEGGLVVEGARNRHVFRGKSARDVLPDLLAGPDGSRSPKPPPGIPAAQLDHLLGVLSRRGLLERPGSAERDRHVSEDVSAFLSRTTGANAEGPSTDDVLDALAAATVYVVAGEPLAEDLADDLRACGIGTVTGLSALLDDRADHAGRSLALILEITDDTGRTEKAFDRCRELGIPALRAAAFGDHIELGPCFLDGLAICAECLRRARAAANWPSTPDASDAAVASVLAGLISLEAVTFAGGLPYLRHPQIVSRIDARECKADNRLLVREEGCPRCGDLLPPGIDQRTELVLAYEESMAPSGPAPEQTLVGLGRIEEARRHRPALTAHPALPLPAAQGPAGTFGAPSEGEPAELDAGVIGEIARRVAGRRAEPRDSADQRWAPTGGNMASVELYVGCEAGFDGLPGTLFRYDDIGHRLIAVSRAPAGSFELSAATDLAGLPVETFFVLVAAVDRLSVKYGDFAYRLAALDAGCATTQLTAVCHGYGRSLVFASRWDERLAQVLRMGPDDRFVTAVAGVLR